MEKNGVDQYKEVEVNFISGREAVLTIFQNGKELEKVTLSDYDDRNKLHQLFVEKGFAKFTNEEIARRREITEQQRKVGEESVANSQSKEKSSRQIRLERRQQKMREKMRMRVKMRELKEARENFEAGHPSTFDG
jgi:hypothetical protein